MIIILTSILTIFTTISVFFLLLKNFHLQSQIDKINNKGK